MKKRGGFGIFGDISDHENLVQLVDTAGNVDHVVIITGCWIYYSNYKIALPLMK